MANALVWAVFFYRYVTKLGIKSYKNYLYSGYGENIRDLVNDFEQRKVNLSPKHTEIEGQQKQLYML